MTFLFLSVLSVLVFVGLSAYAVGRRWPDKIRTKNLQVLLQIHPGSWYLFPFQTISLKSVTAHTWLCFSVRISW